MNLLLKTNLWVMKGVRMISFTGPNWSSKAGGSYPCNPPVNSGKKPMDSQDIFVETMACAETRPGVDSGKKRVVSKQNVVETMAFVAPNALPASEGNPGKPNNSKIMTTPEQCAQETGPGSGGGGGSIKQAGGAFKRMGTAKEEQYFHKKNLKTLERLRERYADDIEYHEEAIEDHQAAIHKLKKEQSDLDKEEK